MGLGLTQFGEGLLVFMVYLAGIAAIWKFFTSDLYRERMAWFHERPADADDDDGPMIQSSYSERHAAVLACMFLLFCLAPFVFLFVIERPHAMPPPR